MANIGKCPQCPKGTHDRILVGGLCPYHYSNPEKNGANTPDESPTISTKSTKKGKLPVKMPRKKIAGKSFKQKQKDAEYALVATQFKFDNPVCAAQIPGICRQKTNDIHHSAGRGANLLKIETFIAVCRKCHTWIHDNHAEAVERGLIKSRNAKSN